MINVNLKQIDLVSFACSENFPDIYALYRDWENAVNFFTSKSFSQVSCQVAGSAKKQQFLRKLSSIVLKHLRPDYYFSKLNFEPLLETRNKKNNISGVISEAFTNELINYIARAPRTIFKIEDSVENYTSAPIGDHVASLNKDHQWVKLGDDSVFILKNVISQMVTLMNAAFGYPVKVVNVRCWETPVIQETRGPNAWHRDGFPAGIYKTILYLTPPSRETGTTEVQLENGHTQIAEGPAGTFFCFDNNTLLHRGIAPQPGTIKKRTIVEFTTIPFLYNKVDPIFAGLNAMFPKSPLF